MLTGTNSKHQPTVIKTTPLPTKVITTEHTTPCHNTMDQTTIVPTSTGDHEIKQYTKTELTSRGSKTITEVVNANGSSSTSEHSTTHKDISSGTSTDHHTYHTDGLVSTSTTAHVHTNGFTETQYKTTDTGNTVFSTNVVPGSTGVTTSKHTSTYEPNGVTISHDTTIGPNGYSHTSSATSEHVTNSLHSPVTYISEHSNGVTENIT